MKGFRLFTPVLWCAGAADLHCRFNFHCWITPPTLPPAFHLGEVKLALWTCSTRARRAEHGEVYGRDQSWGNFTCTGGSRGNFLRASEIASSLAFSPLPNTANTSHTGFLLCQEPRIQILYFQKLWRGSSTEYQPPPFPPLPSFTITFQGKTLTFCCMFSFFFFLCLSFQLSVEKFSPLLDLKV